METPKIALLGKTLYEIQQITANLGMPKFAAKQIASWLYDKKVDSIDEMTNLSLKHREALKESYEVLTAHLIARRATFLLTFNSYVLGTGANTIPPPLN